MNDKRVLAMLDNFSVAKYQEALVAIREEMSDSEISLLREHYEASDYTVTASQLAHKVGFATFGGANLRYGLLASKFLEYFQLDLKESAKLNALVHFHKPRGEWEWVLRPQIVNALKSLGDSYW